MPKQPAQAGETPPLPPCTFLGTVQFSCQAILLKGFNGGALYKPCPPPPGGSLPPLTWTGGNVWACDVFSGAQHWGANLVLSCPGDNPAGTLTLLYADVTGTYTGDYALNPTDFGAGIYLVQDPLESPATMPLLQS